MRFNVALRVMGHFLAFFLVGATSLSAAPSGTSPCDEFARIQAAFQRSWDNPDLWLPGKCHENVAHLARQLQRLVPGLNMNDLNVMLIGSRNPLSPANQSMVPLRARNACSRENPFSGLVEWQYHVVLTIATKSST